jgi:hypothetical protein
MNFYEWEKSSADYGRKLLHSGLDGARCGREEFLQGEPLNVFVNKSARHAMMAAAIGAGIGLLGGLAAKRNSSAGRALAGVVLGGAFGFGAGVAWECRHLGTSIVTRALKDIGKVRDERWLEKHPIDYA